MKKGDLKELIMPLVKECVNEILLQEGVLSRIVSEVATGIAPQTIIAESIGDAPEAPAPPRSAPPAQLKATRKKLMDAVGADAYNGVNLFEGSAPMSSYEVKEATPGSTDLGDPHNAGVDISSLMEGASRMWEAMK